MRARKVDANLTAIVKAARKLGYRVFVNNNELCDLVIQRGSAYPKTELWEVKAKRGRFTRLQQKMREAGWQIRTIRSVEDIL